MSDLAFYLPLADLNRAAGIAGAYKRSSLAHTHGAGGAQPAVSAVRTGVDRDHCGILYGMEGWAQHHTEQGLALELHKGIGRTPGRLHVWRGSIRREFSIPIWTLGF